MKIKRIRVLLISAVALLLLIPAVMIPAFGAATSSDFISYNTPDFDDLALGLQGHKDLIGTFAGNTAGNEIPSGATVVEDPVPSHDGDRVIQMSLEPAATGTKTEQDFVLFNNRVCYITWNANPTNSSGQTVYTGYFTDTGSNGKSNDRYGIQSTDNKETALVIDVSTDNKTEATPKYAITSGTTITYKNAPYEITWDDSATTDLFGKSAYFGYFISGNVAFRVKSTDGKQNCVIIPKNTTYTVSNDAAVVEAVKGGKNIYRNLTIAHDAVSYTDAEKVVLQVEYYIPSGCKGIFWGQQQSFKYYLKDSTDTAQKSTSWLNYYTIDAESAEMTVYAFTNTASERTKIPLEKDAWVTVSMAIDLAEGTMDLYINHVLKESGELMHGGKKIKNITLNKNTFQFAKVNPNQGYVESLCGEFYIDNASVYRYDDSQKVVFEKSVNEAGEPAIGVTMTLASGRVCGAAFGDTVLVNDTMTHEPLYLTSELTDGLITPVKGASIRLTNAGGIRFGTQVNSEKMDVLQQMKENGQIKDLQIGTLITPASYVEKAGGFTKEALDQLPYSAKYLDVRATVGAYFTTKGVTMTEGYDKLFVGSILNIKPANLTRAFAGVGYVKIIALDGTEHYFYSYEYTDSDTLNKDHARAISVVADDFIDKPGYEEYQDILLGFKEGLIVMSISNNIIQNVQYTANNFFFQNAEGVSMRLSYEGKSGWRFQAVKPTDASKPYNSFNNMGAGQSLALYMGEYSTDETKRIFVEECEGYIRIYEKVTCTKHSEHETDDFDACHGSYVEISTTGAFNVQFYASNGEAMNNINGVSAATVDGQAQITLTGSLKDKSEEAIYGGGQRFDSANKRGLSLSLFTYDSYNTDGNKGTYTAIPLFLSTRGSGLFINRYERIVADFDVTAKNQWTVALFNSLIDCYIYATGDMTDALNGYANISGYATMPEEWAQGTLVCRYNPDFQSLDGTVIYDKLTDIPGYEDIFMDSARTRRAMFEESIAKGTYLYELVGGKVVTTYYYDGEHFCRVTKKGNPGGYGVRQVVESLMNAGMKPDAIIIEALDYAWLNGTQNTAQAQQNRQNIKEIADWLHENDIKLMLYMGVGQMSVNMAGYKEEYFLHADITVEVDESVTGVTHSYKDKYLENTKDILWSATSDNPDAIGTNAQKYLDITNPEAVDWYMNQIWGVMIDLGVDGCKIDFCEVMPNGVTPLKVKNNNETGYVQVGTVTIDYKWHDPSVFGESDIHHAYPTYFETIFYQSMMKQKEEKKLDGGFNLLTRGGGIGAQRNPSMWAGDQERNEGTLSVQLLTLINSGLSGLPFISYDMAGYAYDSWGGGYFGNKTDLGQTPEEVSDIEARIYLRAIQYTAFTTMIQTHGDVRMVYDMKLKGYADDYVQTVSKQYVDLREALTPYIRKWSEVSCKTGMPLVRHMALQYQDDKNTWDIDDQFMLGDAIMVAPILELYQGYRTDIYLPEGKWQNMLTGRVYTVGAGGMKIEAVRVNMNQISVFLNMESEDYESLLEVFNGDIWQAINGGNVIDPNATGAISNPQNDPYEADIFTAK